MKTFMLYHTIHKSYSPQFRSQTIEGIEPILNDPNYIDSSLYEIHEVKSKAIKVLSIQQPWAELIINGRKDVENRTWATKFRGEFYIHAGKKFDLESYVWMWNKRNNIPDSPDKFQLGGIVGKANLVDCLSGYDSIWSIPGQFQFILSDAKHVDFIPMKGQLNFFNAIIWEKVA